MSQLSVIDIFCGAGGFSEGFRQQGYKILLGIDAWEPAVNTFNHNFDLFCKVKNVLDFEYSIEEIELLPDSDVIIGSPPCVTFSSSNKSGKADKSLGVRLTEIFLRIVAVKKHKPNTRLKAWFMENVANSSNYLNDYYTFKDLNLSEWARENKLSPNKKAIILKGNQPLINSADYGSPQIRKRVVSGEFVFRGKLLIPEPTHKQPETVWNLPPYISLSEIKGFLPNPNMQRRSNKVIKDFLYPEIKLKASEITDHFYDTGLYECEWRQSKFLKTNHPYMGKMSFPENESKPSRTITATKIGTSREAIIYKSEYNRKGDGEYRTPTIREAACMMGFPITYQFLGTEGVKCRLIGNAVCPSVSRAFARLLRIELNLSSISESLVKEKPNTDGVLNLNTYSPKVFNNPPRRNRGSRFRRHPFKDGNMTVTLSNYDIIKNEKKPSKWITSVQYGNGEGFPSHNFPDGFYLKIEPLIAQLNKGKEFLDKVENGFSAKISDGVTLQEMYETQLSKGNLLEPTYLIEEVVQLIERLNVEDDIYIQSQEKVFVNKKVVPVKQLFALYVINRVSSNANR